MPNNTIYIPPIDRFVATGTKSVIRNLYTGNDTDAFSVANVLFTGLYSHTHEIGHNLG